MCIFSGINVERKMMKIVCYKIDLYSIHTEKKLKPQIFFVYFVVVTIVYACGKWVYVFDTFHKIFEILKGNFSNPVNFIYLKNKVIATNQSKIKRRRKSKWKKWEKYQRVTLRIRIRTRWTYWIMPWLIK